MADLIKQSELYEIERPRFSIFSDRIRALLCDLVTANSIDVHIIEARTKSVSSFKDKLSRPGKSYKSPLTQMPDLCGCRVITYYQDDCVKVADILKKEFIVVDEELSHQPDLLAVDRFGYLSAHYVLKLGPTRINLDEWKNVKDLHAEVQIRTVVQHAWSAVSHAVQYKDESNIPSNLQRRLHRIAGLFEIADEEFVAIRDQKRSLQTSAASAISGGNTNIPITSTSLREYIIYWEKQYEVESKVLEAGFGYYTDNENSFIREIYELSVKAGLTRISDIDDSVLPIDSDFLKAVFDSQKNPSTWQVNSDFTLYILLIRKYPSLITTAYLVENGWDEAIAKRVLAVCRK